MISARRWLAALGALIFVAIINGPIKSAGFPIPGLPGLDPTGIAVNAASKQLAPFVQQRQPVILDWSAVYPTLDTLPGPAFAPNNSAAQRRTSDVVSQLKHAGDGNAKLKPGDYTFQFVQFCTDVHRHAGSQAEWIFGPLRGARAHVLSVMYSRASAMNPPVPLLQSLSWSLQAGLRYDQLSTEQRQLADRLIPDLKGELTGNFIDQVKDRWNQLAGTIPNLPSYESALGRMGDLGQTLLNIEQAQATIIAHANDYDTLRSTFAPPTSESGGAEQTPWSQLSDRIYARYVTDGHYEHQGTIQLRVVAQPGAAPNDVVSVPFTPIISYAPHHKSWQPLTFEVAGTPGS